MMQRVPIAGKRVTILKKRTDEEPYVILDKTENEEQSDEDHSDAGSEEGLQLRVISMFSRCTVSRCRRGVDPRVS